MSAEPKSVIFACTHSAGRSQIAAAFFNLAAHPARFHATAAGLEPAEHVHPEVIEVMREVGVDLSQARPRKLTLQMQSNAAFVVTMGCGEKCPLIPGPRRADWTLPDPMGQPLDRVREIRDEIGNLVLDLVTQKGWADPP